VIVPPDTDGEARGVASINTLPVPEDPPHPARSAASTRGPGPSKLLSFMIRRRLMLTDAMGCTGLTLIP
jgi:hypothetical protein